jgi:hypothetical protein
MTHLSRGTGLLGLALFTGMAVSGQSTGQNTAKVSQDFGRVPIYFEENRGQTDARARFIARTGRLAAFLTQDGWTLSMHGEAISMRISDASQSARLAPEGTVGGISNYYLGSRVITGLPHYASVRVTEIRPGIDIVYHASERDLEYDFVIRPGADPKALRLRFEGGKPPILAGNGDLLFKTSSGELRQRKPRVWQEVEGKRHEVECSYAFLGPSEVGLVLENYNRSAELVIDPVLAYSTYLGGTNQDVATGIAVDVSGNAHVTGYTASTDFPATTGSFHGYYDVFVTKLNPSGSGLVYSTFIGGFNQDQANGIAVDNAGNAYITGFTTSSDFPFTINHLLGFQDAFVAKLGSTGVVLYCTAVGGNNQDSGAAIAVDAQGFAYIAGFTNSNNSLATAGSYKTTLTGNSDAFVAKLLPSGQISYATYLGGASDDNATAIALDSSGNAYIGGITSSANFPATPGAYATALAGGQDAFVAKLNSLGSALIYATYLGGSSNDSVSGLAVDAAGNAYISGTTQSSDFPTTMGAFETSRPAQFGTSGFVSKLNAAGGGLTYSTFLGGNGSDSTVAIAVDINGFAYVAGNAQSSNFPTTPGALRIRPASNFFCCDTDMFFVKVAVDGSALTYSTLLGSINTTEDANALALDGNNGIYLAGYTSSQTYPTTSGAFQASSPKPSQFSPTSAVVSKIDLGSTVLCNPSVSPQSQSLPGRGGAISFNLTLSPGCPWEALADSFITLSAPTHGVISVEPIGLSGTVPLNDSTSSGRIGTVRIGPATFSVNQDAGSCQDPVISPLSVMFDSSGGLHDMILTLPSACPWVALSNVPWLIVTANPSGNGSATITIFAAQNSFSTRTATLTLAGKPIMVTQTGSTCTAMAGATPMTFSAQGGTGLARITTNSGACQWTAYNIVPWIQLAALSNIGQGSGSVPFNVASNPGSLPRSGQILIADQTLTITQSAGPAGTVSGFTLSNFAGGGSFSLVNRGDGGPALGALLSNPYGLAFDPATGNMYIAESGASRIRVVTPDGNINTFAGGGSATGENVPATSALLSGTNYVAVDSSSSIYIDDDFARIRKISQGNIATFAGTTTRGFSGDTGAATSAQLSFPLGLAADTGGNIYIADSTNNRVRKVNGGTITTFAGGGNSGLGDNGPATSAILQSPQGLAVDTGGNLYIADSGDNRVRKVSQGNISTFAGGGNGGDGGPATSAFLSNLAGLAIDQLGDVFLVDYSSSGRVRMVGLDGKISTVAGSGVLGNFSPLGLAADTSGNVYFSDSSSGLVRKLTPLSFCTYGVATPPTLPPASGGLSIAVTAAAGCNWTAASDLSWLMVSSGTPGMGNGMVNFTVSSNPSTSSRTGTIAIAGQAIQVTQAGTQPPATVSVTPSSGNGASQTFSFVYSDPNGFAYLSTTYLGFSSTFAFGNACYSYYDRNANGLFLLNDAANAWLGPVTPGAAAILQNGQCTLNAAGSSVSGLGNNLTVNLALTFKNGFGGVKNIYMCAIDSGGLSSNWQQRGSWMMFVPNNQPPTAISVTPSSGSGSSQTFSFVFSDPNGFTDLSTTYMGFSSTFAFGNACYSYYDRNANALWLLNDAANGWLGPVTPGAAASLQNSQCTLNAAGSSVSGFSNSLTINEALTFKAPFGGAKNVYMCALDNSGLSSNWQQLGSWTVPNLNNLPPTTVSVTPSSGSGSSQTFSFVFSDPNGFTDLSTTYIGFSSTFAFGNACYSYYDRNANALWLLNDAANGWLGPITPGTASTLQNNQCSLSGAGSSVSGVSNNLTVNFALTFKAPFAGAKNIYMCALDNGGASSNWQQRGTWTAQ